MEIITEGYIKGNHQNGEKCIGTILLKDYKTCLTKTNKPYISGMLQSGIQLQFKAWDNSSAFSVLSEEKLQGSVVAIQATWNEYNGSWSLLLDSVAGMPDADTGVYLKSKYNLDAYLDGLKLLMEKNLSERGMKLANAVIFKNDDFLLSFKTEFAAKSHHDNCRGGLLAHTYKVCNIMCLVVNMYTHLYSTPEEKDLFVLGALLHDIGKTIEMKNGVYQPKSFVTHRFLGIELLDKDMIVSLYDEMWYYHLVSVMLQHHGEYADPYKSVVAFVVHKVDNLDSDFSMLQQMMEETTGVDIKVNGTYLSRWEGGEDNAGQDN